MLALAKMDPLRFKENVQTNVPDLHYISQLHPVTYNLNTSNRQSQWDDEGYQKQFRQSRRNAT